MHCYLLFFLLALLSTRAVPVPLPKTNSGISLPQKQDIQLSWPARDTAISARVVEAPSAPARVDEGTTVERLPSPGERPVVVGDELQKARTSDPRISKMSRGQKAEIDECIKRKEKLHKFPTPGWLAERSDPTFKRTLENAAALLRQWSTDCTDEVEAKPKAAEAPATKKAALAPAREKQQEQRQQQQQQQEGKAATASRQGQATPEDQFSPAQPPSPPQLVKAGVSSDPFSAVGPDHVARFNLPEGVRFHLDRSIKLGAAGLYAVYQALRNPLLRTLAGVGVAAA